VLATGGIAVSRSGDPEVEDLRLAALIHQDIGWFQIAVNDSALMCMVYGPLPT
jgi:hypothetical protein